MEMLTGMELIGDQVNRDARDNYISYMRGYNDFTFLLTISMLIYLRRIGLVRKFIKELRMKELLTIIVVVAIAIPLGAATFDILSESSGQLVVKYRLGEYEIIDDGEYSFIKTAGTGHTTFEGAPMLPETVYYVAVPQNGSISVNLINSSSYSHSISSPVMPVPVVERGDKVSEYIWEINNNLYQTRNESLITIGEKRRFRYNYIVPITISPADYDYNGSRLEMTEELTFSVSIRGDIEQQADEIDNLDISSLVLNPDDAGRWTYRPTVNVDYAPFHRSQFWYRFEVPQDGMYKLSSDDLTQLPLEDIDPRNIRIFSTGGHVLEAGRLSSNPFLEIPVHISGEETGSFDEDDFILFYGQNRDGYEKTEALPISTRCPDIYFNPFSQNGVYWLTYGGDFTTSPLRMENQGYDSYQVTRGNSPAYYHFESENLKREHNGFGWFHSALSGTSDTNHNYRINITDPDLSTDQQLKIGVLSEMVGMKSISLRVNDQTVINRLSWTVRDHNEFSDRGNFLQNGDNEVTLTVHRTSPMTLYFDYFRVEYDKLLIKRNEQLKFHAHAIDTGRTVKYNLSGSLDDALAFEINGFAEANLLDLSHDQDEDTMYITGRGERKYVVGRLDDFYSVTNFNEVVPTDLANIMRPVNNIIITADMFLDYAEQLAETYELHEDMPSMVVTQQAIFDQFNSGMPDPEAIRRFLLHAFHNYPDYEGVSLKNVVLLGSGSIDWRNFSGQADVKNRLILYHRGTDTSDDFFVDMTGDFLPDISIGRLTAQNNDQMRIIFNKLDEYRNNLKPGLWRNTMLIIADDEYTSTSFSEWIHSHQAQQISNTMSEAIITDKVFAIEHSFDSFGNKPTARDDIVEKVNEGKLIWYYIGHGNYDLMGHENYFRAVDIESLNNREMLPMFIAASCDVGKFDYYSYSSLSERFLVYPDGGSIASLAATGLSSPNANHRLVSGFLDLVVNQYTAPGLSLLLVKQRHTDTQNRRYAYLGDPVMKIVPPQRVAGIEIEGEPDSLYALQPVNIVGSLYEDIEEADRSKQNAIVRPAHRESYLGRSSDVSNYSRIGSYDTAEVVAFSSERYFRYDVQTLESVFELNYSKWGNAYFRGSSSVENGEFTASFIVPNDIRAGNQGRIISYYFDEESNQDYVSYYYPKRFTNAIYENAVADSIPPAINMWLNTKEFHDGDVVPPNPVLHAIIEDQSGINILGELGHKILLMIDEDSSPVDVTEGFSYDTNSFTIGKLEWQLSGLKDGDHRLQLIVFDNHNNPSVANINFTIKSRDAIVISDMLPYPNPMDDSGYFTFILNSDADISISIYTIRGRRIRTLKLAGEAGFNKKIWDVRDNDGDRLANNTYLYKIRARQNETGDVTEKIGQVVILR